MSPRRSVLASIGAGCCLAASVIAGGYAASGAMPFSDWPGAIFSSAGAAEVALAPATRAAAPVLTLPASTREGGDEDRGHPARRRPVRRAARRRPPRRRPRAVAGRHDPARHEAARPEGRRRPGHEPDDRADDHDDDRRAGRDAAAPAADAGPTQAAAPVAQPATRKVKIGSVSSTFANAHDSSSGQPELRVQMAVADAAATTGTRTVALSLKLAPTDVASLMRSAQAINSSNIALETQVDVVDATVTAAGQPTCADGQCLRVQMKFAPDTRVNPVDGPEVQLLDDGDAISNRVKVVVKIDADDLGTKPDGAVDGARAGGRRAERPLAAAAADGRSRLAARAPATTDTATVALPDDDPAAGTPDGPPSRSRRSWRSSTRRRPRRPHPDPAPARRARAGPVDGGRPPRPRRPRRLPRPRRRPRRRSPPRPTARSRFVGCARCASSCPTRSRRRAGRAAVRDRAVPVGEGPLPAGDADARMAVFARRRCRGASTRSSTPRRSWRCCRP